MSQLVVTFHPDGKVETLLKDKVLDTRMFGDRKIERITVIEHDEATQRFYIRWLKGPKTGLTEPSLFNSYEEAVEHEINCVNYLRLNGYSFA